MGINSGNEIHVDSAFCDVLSIQVLIIMPPYTSVMLCTLLSTTGSAGFLPTIHYPLLSYSQNLRRQYAQLKIFPSLPCR